MPSAYCTRTDVETRVSALGVSLRIDDDTNGASQTLRVTDCIQDASAWVDFYCGARYDPAALATSDWVKFRTRDLAIMALCSRRLNSIPKVVQTLYDEAIEALKQIQLQQVPIPGLAMRKNSAPVLSQPRPILFPYPYTAIERSRSTGKPAGYTQRNDPYEENALP